MLFQVWLVCQRPPTWPWLELEQRWDIWAGCSEKSDSESSLCCEMVFPKDSYFYYVSFSSKTASFSTSRDTQLNSRFRNLAVNKINWKVMHGTQAWQLPRP